MRSVVGSVCGVLLALAAGAVAAGASADAMPQRHRAEIVVERPAAFIRLPLTPQVYAHSAPDLHGGLADLRVVDAAGARVPFALLAPRADEQRPAEIWRDAKPYRLPPRAAGAPDVGLPLELSVESGRLTVRPGAAGKAARAEAPGWLFDLGERDKDAAAPQTLRLQWSGPAEFTAAFTLQHSADLKRWTPGAAGQIVALAAGGAALTQPDVALPAGVGRYVRLVWSGQGPFPKISGAQAATPQPRSVVLDAPQALTVAPSAEPRSTGSADAAAARALHFDLGAPVPVVRLELQLSGTRVLPAQVQVRERLDERWQPLAATVFYRLERDGQTLQSPPLVLQRRLRYLRLVPDERAGTPDAAGLKLVAQVQLASLVFAQQGQPPYALLAGADKAEIGALPLDTLVPDVQHERERFGRAALGAWSEVAEAARQADADAARARLRPWLLWSVMIGGVAVLGAMVWRMLRTRPPQGA